MVQFLSAEEMKALYWEKLLENEAVNQLIMGNMKAVCKAHEEGKEVQEDTRFGAILQENRVAYFFCNFLPYSMVVTSANPRETIYAEKCALELAEAFHNQGIVFTGIHSSDVFAKAFMDCFARQFREEMSMEIMVTKKANTYPLCGEIVRATVNDVEKVTEMYCNFCKEAVHQDKTYEEVYTKVREMLDNPERDIWLYQVEGEIIGMHGSTRKLERGLSLTLVYVYPQYRGKGYCKEMVSWSTEHYLEQGCQYVSLYVDRKNPFSNAAYQAVGFEYVAKTVDYKFVEEM